jgi:hypothetical protein
MLAELQKLSPPFSYKQNWRGLARVEEADNFIFIFFEGEGSRSCGKRRHFSAAIRAL